ncbi:hypothetical protein P0Y31_08465 [Knoellia sp. 3-2P3]|uniref:hypothetical protein n=1 Tax=unclassified Knoellia TaxID=2618719 RepID=UPI0023DA42CD|nr:hypothetical protein [Knoellia sp. 3-2P3]MDF2092373.1 hypothetical protein [Knoellia sp. 3-2P3]
MADQGTGQRQGREPVGSVAEETARLLEALGGWAEGLGVPAGEAPAADHGAGDHDDGDHDDEATAAPGADRDQRDQRAHGHAAGARHTTRCEHCGVSSRAGEALTCQLCPVCQGISLLRSVRPETVERLADLAAALSGALRDIAADRFGQPPPPPPPAPPRGQRVQDIAVDDEDEPGTAPTTDRPRRTQESTAP